MDTKLVRVAGNINDTTHRICMVQLGVPIRSRHDSRPCTVDASQPYLQKLHETLTVMLQEQWASVAVLPELAVPKSALLDLLNHALRLMRERDATAGGCVLCLPIEHLLLRELPELITAISGLDGFAVEGFETATDLMKRILRRMPPADAVNAFANIAVTVAFGTSGPDATAHCVFQPKRFPSPYEKGPSLGAFAYSDTTYVLDVGGTRFLTAICFDYISEDPITGDRGVDLLGEIEGEVHYLLVPQFNPKPLDANFQQATAHLYYDQSERRKTLRVIAPNTSKCRANGEEIPAGQSWITVCPGNQGDKLPECGLWERTVISSIRDPFTRQVLPDIHTLGHHARRLRLAADGEWLVSLCAPPAQHLFANAGPAFGVAGVSADVYSWNGSAWDIKDSEAFVRECRFAERHPLLTKFADLPAWIKENYGGANSFSPSYREFSQQEVVLPLGPLNAALSGLQGFQDICVLGDRASGKTVFGLGVALNWMAENGGRSLFIDFGADEILEAGELLSEITGFVTYVTDPLVVVLDNAHLGEREAQRVVREIRQLRKDGKRVQAILLSRAQQRVQHEKNALHDDADVLHIELRADEEAFLCVARRLLRKRGKPEAVEVEWAEGWLEACGADLAIFATAFNPSSPSKLDRGSIARQVRERYLVPADESPGHLDVFLELCVLSSLDIRADDETIWNKRIELLFPNFCRKGTILRLPGGADDPKQYCRLFHPSLGALILQVKSNFEAPRFENLWLEKSLALCRRSAALVGMILRRLKRSYVGLVDEARWCKQIESEEGLVERAICSAPFEMAIYLRGKGLSWRWDKLISLQGYEGLDLLIQRLSETPGNGVVIFLNYLKAHGMKGEAKTIAARLLDGDRYVASLCRTQADGVAAFLGFLDMHGMKARAKQMAASLVTNEKFIESLCRTQAHFVVGFLKYLDKHDMRDDADRIVGVLITDEIFIDTLCRTHAQLAAVFLRYVDRRGMRIEAGRLVARLIADGTFVATLSRTPAGGVASFLRYLDDHGLSEEARDLARRLVGDENFVATLFLTQADYVATFLYCLDDHALRGKGVDLAAELIADAGFVEYLFRTSANCVAHFLRCLDDHEMASKAGTLASGLVTDDGFVEKLLTTPADSLVPFFRYLDGRGMQEDSERLVMQVVQDERFVASLIRTPIDHTTTFFRYLDEHGSQDRSCDLCKRMLKNSAFWAVPSHGTGGNLNAFLSWLSALPDKDGPNELRTLVREWFSNESNWRLIANWPISVQGTFLRYALDSVGINTIQAILDYLYGGMDFSSFKEAVLGQEWKDIAGFWPKLREAGLTLPEDQMRALDIEVPPVVPDPDYPQEALLVMTMDKLLRLFSRFTRGRSRYRLYCIWASFCSDEAAVASWIERRSKEELKSFSDWQNRVYCFFPVELQDVFEARLSQILGDTSVGAIRNQHDLLVVSRSAS